MLICYYDKEKKQLSKKIFSEVEFTNLMNRRKIDQIWQTIYFIQNLVKKEDNFKDLLHIQFDYEK